MIRCVLGDVERSTLEGKRVLAHEHIRCVSNDMLACFGDSWIDFEKLENTAESVLLQLKERCGLGLYVDATPCDLGRDAKQLVRLSKKCELDIIASTGLYFFPNMITSQRTVDELVPIFLRECAGGLDGSDVKPGMLKCATDSPGLTPDNKKRIAVMGRVQAETGLPLYAHCRHTEDTAHGQLDIFAENGANLSKVVIGHATSRMDADYLSTLFERGCYVAFDQPGTKPEWMAPVIAELIGRGFGKQIIVSLDHPLYSEFRRTNESGMQLSIDEHADFYASIFERLMPELISRGIAKEQCEALFGSNVFDWLDF